nr:HAD family hydrolase [uncultured Flavobacterium sp.]
MDKKTIIFDLDDTLIPEIDFLKSAFQEIADYVDASNSELFDEMIQWYQNKENVFLKVQEKYNTISVSDLKNKYRNHFPNFDSKSENRELLLELKEEGHFLGLITDGYSVTQRNKIRALGIESLFDLIVISEEFGSEKPNEDNYSAFHKFGPKDIYYIGDNISKDFITPNKMGWTSICVLDNGKNIHTQNFNLSKEYLPKYRIHNLKEVFDILKL